MSTGTEAADRLLAEAIAAGASDVHLDPISDGMSLRMRVDGRFTNAQLVEAEESQRLIGRLKVMADLMVYRSDIPQEGRMLLPDGHEARLALIPSSRGEKATLRLFSAGGRLERLDDLGLGEASTSWISQHIGDDSGLILVVGPSGSGKTSTLYATMSEIVARRGEFCQLTSIEDPVERQLDGVTQVQVDPARGLDFAGGLKYLLRQDPEIIMVGEIRDSETARIAVRAAMTGHLVFSSLHCGRASEARPRLLEMGAESYAVNLSLVGVIAQRLLRRLCSSCSGSGCEHCLDSGYRGRLAVSEIITGKETSPSITLKEAAETLASSGITTAAEVQRVFGGQS